MLVFVELKEKKQIFCVSHKKLGQLHVTQPTDKQSTSVRFQRENNAHSHWEE